MSWYQNETDQKWKISRTLLDRQTLCFNWYENRELKIRLWWAWARERKKIAFFNVYSYIRKIQQRLYFISVYRILNKLSEHLCFFKKISMWAYKLMVNNIVRSKYIFVENNKLKNYFLNIYLDLLSKVHLQSNLYLEEAR